MTLAESAAEGAVVVLAVALVVVVQVSAPSLGSRIAIFLTMLALAAVVAVVLHWFGVRP